MQVLYSADNYNPQASADSCLALAINDKALAFAVHNGEGTLQMLGHYEFYVSLAEDESVFFDFIRSQDNLKLKYKSTKIILQGYKNTLVPGSLYNELYIESYLRHLYETEKSEIIKETTLFNNEAKLVYAVKEYLFYPARSKYYDAEIEPHAANYLRKSAHHHSDKLNVFVEETDLYLVHCQNSKPVYYNRFAYETVDEAAYHILNYYQVFGAQPQALPLLLHGNVHPQLVEMLNTYTGKSETATQKNKGVVLSPNFEFEFLIDFCH